MAKKETTPKTQPESTGAELIVTKHIPVPTTKDQVPETLAALREQLEALTQNLPEEKEDLVYDGPGGRHVIKDVKSLTTLTEIHSAVKARTTAFADSAKELGFEGDIVEFKISGKTLPQWTKALKAAGFVLKNKTKIEDLKATIKDLEEFESEDDKLRKKMAAAMERANRKLS